MAQNQGGTLQQIILALLMSDPSMAQALQQSTGGGASTATPGGVDPTNGLSGGGLPSLAQALNTVNGAQQAAGGQASGTSAVKAALQQSLQNTALNGALGNPADASAYGVGSLTKNPELLPTLEGQEQALASKQKAAMMRYRASQDNRDAGPGLHGSAGAYQAKSATPRWLQQVEPGGELSDMPSYMQSNLLDWHAQHPEGSPGMDGGS